MALEKVIFCLNVSSVDAFAHWLRERMQSICQRKFPPEYLEGACLVQLVRLPSQTVDQCPIALKMMRPYVVGGRKATGGPPEFCAIRFKIVSLSPPLPPRHIEVTAECNDYLVMDDFEGLLEFIGQKWPEELGRPGAKRVGATTERIQAIKDKMGYESTLELVARATLGELGCCLEKFHSTRAEKRWIYKTIPTLGETLCTRLRVHTDSVSCLGGQIWYVEALDVHSDDELGTPFCIISASPLRGRSDSNVLNANCWPDWNKGDTPLSYREYLTALLGESRQREMIKHLPEWLTEPERTEPPLPTGDGTVDLPPMEDPTGGKYGSCRDLTIDDVRDIVKRCRAFQARGGKIVEFYRRKSQSFSPGEPRSYELETLRSWLNNPKFAPEDTQKLT